MESLGQLSVDEGEGGEDAFRERGYSEGEKYSKRRGKGFFRQFSLGEEKQDKDVDMAVGKTVFTNFITL